MPRTEKGGGGTAIAGRLAALGLAVLLIGYAGYQLFRYLYSPYKTERAYEYTVSDSVEAEGIFVRTEEALPALVQEDGVLGYTVRDGEKVIDTTVIANQYPSASQAQDLVEAEALQEEIALLERVQAASDVAYTNTETLNSQLNASVGQLVDVIHSGDATQAADLRGTLLEQICRRQLSVGEELDLAPRIEYLAQEQEQLAASASEGSREITAGTDGYFCRTSDGLESYYNPDNLREMTPAQLEKAIQTGETPPGGGNVGKIVTGHSWYVGMVLPREQAEKFRVGTTVYLDMPSHNLRELPMTVDTVNLSEEETAPDDEPTVVVLEGNYISEGTLSARSGQIVINFTQYTGLRVSDSALRTVDGQQGVYIITGYNIQFRPVNVIYSGDGFKLCALPAVDDNRTLQPFDEVIVEGIDLYDGKPI